MAVVEANSEEREGCEPQLCAICPRYSLFFSALWSCGLHYEILHLALRAAQAFCDGIHFRQQHQRRWKQQQQQQQEEEAGRLRRRRRRTHAAAARFASRPAL